MPSLPPVDRPRRPLPDNAGKAGGIGILALLMAGVLACVSPGLGADDAMGGISTTRLVPDESLLEVHINDQAMRDTAVLLSIPPTGRMLASSEEFTRWRLKVPQVKPYRYEGGDYYPLDGISGLTYRMEARTQALYISAPADAFMATQLDGLERPAPVPQTSPPGGFLNYGAFGSHSGGQSAVSALMEAGLFNSWGVGTSSFLGEHVSGSANRWTRLDSVWTRDLPADRTTLRLGDGVTASSMIGSAVRFGGVQYGTNFATQPYLVTFPLPSVQGQAALPSTLQLYVNGQLQHTEQVAPGPFTLPQIPVTTGPGTITLVVRDLMGREQLVTLPFFATTALLTPGLDDYSVSFGEERQNYGTVSGDYGPFVASGLYRKGFSQGFTGETGGAVSAGAQTLEAGGTFAYDGTGTFEAALAGSHAPAGNGRLWMLGLQQTTGFLGFGFDAQFASPHYTQPGFLPGAPAPHEQLSADIGTSFERGGNLQLAYIAQDSQTMGSVHLLSLSYSISIGDSSFLSVNALHTNGSGNGNTVFLNFSMALGTLQSASAGVTHQGGENRSFVQLQRSLPAGTGFGYRLAQESGGAPFTGAELDYQNGVGSYTAGATSAAGQTSYLASVMGGIGLIDGQPFAARHIDDAFGLVETDYPGVTVYSQGQAVGVTDAQGKFVIPRLQPYQDNTIGIGAEDLPLDTEIGNTSGHLVPYYRSGLVAKFQVKATHGATLSVRLEDGSPLPVGADLRADGGRDSYPVAYYGQAYITGVSGRVHMRAAFEGRSCGFDISVPTGGEALPDLGTVICKETKP